MRKRFFVVFASLAMVMQSCAQTPEQPAQTAVVQQTTVPVERLTLTDFTDVASATIDGVVHIKTEMTQLTPLYQSFFGFIIQQGGSGAPVTAHSRTEGCF